MLLFAPAPVNRDIAVGIACQRGKQNRTHVREPCTSGNQDQRALVFITQPGFAMRNIDLDFPVFQNTVHHGHGVKI